MRLTLKKSLHLFSLYSRTKLAYTIGGPAAKVPKLEVGLPVAEEAVTPTKQEPVVVENGKYLRVDRIFTYLRMVLFFTQMTWMNLSTMQMRTPMPTWSLNRTVNTPR